MKLINIKPIIFEADEDDIFAEAPPLAGEALLKQLQNKSDSMDHQSSKLRQHARNIIENIPGTIESWRYPGGHLAITADLESGKIIQVGNTILPSTHKNQQIHQRAERLKQRATQLDNIRSKLNAKIKRLANSEANKQLTAAQSGSTPTQIPESQIPHTINAGGRLITNPYFESTRARYAGDPKFFPWKPAELQQYLKLNKMLTTNGLGELTVIYAATVIKTGGTIPRLNFVVVGANGKFAWYKYGKNVWHDKVYINGNVAKTNIFLDEMTTKPNTFKKLIASMKTP